MVISSGASGMLDWVVGALSRPQANILLPRPGFVYSNFCISRNVSPRYYNLEVCKILQSTWTEPSSSLKMTGKLI